MCIYRQGCWEYDVRNGLILYCIVGWSRIDLRFGRHAAVNAEQRLIRTGTRIDSFDVELLRFPVLTEVTMRSVSFLYFLLLSYDNSKELQILSAGFCCLK